ncbi:MAG: hypothetical protein GC200_08340 [Tepidisphaera sp.]|nr:hypothetical protein [Tepidisphaera sp.]
MRANPGGCPGRVHTPRFFSIPPTPRTCLLASFALLCFFSASTRAQTIRLLTLDAARCGTCPTNGATEDIATTPFMSVAREAMLSPANFGPAGVVPQSLTLRPPVHEFTPASLGGADVVLISSTRPIDTSGHILTLREQSLLGQFVQQGGGLFVFWNNGAQQLASQFGASGSDAFGGAGCETTLGSASPVVGPFGSGAGCVISGYRGYFTSVPPGSAILTNLCGAALDSGLGHAVIINDEEWTWNTSVSPCGDATLDNQKLRLFLNSLAHVLPTSPCVAFRAISSQPQSVDTCPTSAADLSTLADGAGPFSYAWQVESSPGTWLAVNDGALPYNAGTIIASSSHSATLHLDCAVLPGAPALRFRAVASNACGDVTSDAATLSFRSPADPACAGPACDPDVNQDGVADQGDVDYLINVIAGGQNPSNIDPDFNQDGVADQGDIDALVNVVAGGPCP